MTPPHRLSVVGNISRSPVSDEDLWTPNPRDPIAENRVVPGVPWRRQGELQPLAVYGL